MWLDLENVRGDFNDATNSIHLECVIPGLARIERGLLWECLLVEDRDVRSERAEIRGNTAVLKYVTASG